MNKILHMVQIKAPLSKVYSAISTQDGLSSWWTTNVKAESGEGGQVDFFFMEGMTPNMKVTKLEKDKAVHWKCVGGHDNWKDNTFSFDLSENDGVSNVMFIQNYAQEMPDPVYGMYNYNWGYYLDSLREYLENGKGKPFQA
jgi:uncharacterized protein YndB with AHSA1/START domain